MKVKILESLHFERLEHFGFALDMLVEQDGKVWFNAQEILDQMGVSRRPLDRIPVAQKCLIKSSAGGHGPLYVDEPALYNLLGFGRTKKAKEFVNWVTTYVVTTIRKIGGYIEGMENLPEKDRMVVETEIRNLRKQVADMELKLLTTTGHLDRTDSICAMQAERIRELMNLLVENGIDPYQVKAKAQPATTTVVVTVPVPVKVDDPLIRTPSGMIMRRSEFIALRDAR